MTDYNKWNKVKMSDLGWTAEDEYRERVTPAMQAYQDGQENEQRLKEAKDSITMAQRDQVRLRKALADINKRREEVESQTNWLLLAVFVVVCAILFAMMKFL